MANKDNPKYYVVWIGRITGIYHTWEECKEQVHKYPGSLYRLYDNRIEAAIALRDGPPPPPEPPRPSTVLF